tara:strand:+ start:749 stop:961 length:213 start_codon:yes stop_codon:yes gene_type:complete
MHGIKHMAGGGAKAVNATVLSYLRNYLGARPLCVYQIQDRKNFGIVVLLAGHSIHGLDFVASQDEAIARD